MKFLGIHLGGHDSNFTYTNGKEVRYFKPERFKQVKHFRYDNIFYLLHDLKLYGIDINDLDAVCMSYEFDQEKAEGSHYHLTTSNIFKCPVYSINHHYAHALSCFTEPNYENITKSFVLDGTGDASTTTGEDFETTSVFGNSHELLTKYRLPQISMGRALRILGHFWGMDGHKNDFAGKLMAFQSYGKVDNQLVDVFKDYNIGQLDEIFKNPPETLEHSVDWLRTRHYLCEQIIPKFFKSIANNDEVISYTGGVAQNILINPILKKWNTNIIIPPQNSDEGISLGCVELLRTLYDQDTFSTKGFPYWQEDNVQEAPTTKTIKQAAELIAKGKIIGWCQGKGEIGPRALGNRSILMRADIKGGKDIINSKVKHREEYRPFGCSVLVEDLNKHTNCTFESPYMLHAVTVTDSSLESITHVDGTTRPQTVKDGVFSELLHEVKKLTGTSIVLNTSLNVNGYPIANPEIAKSMKSGLDAVFIGDTNYI